MTIEEKIWSGILVKKNSMAVFYVVLSTCCVGLADLSCHLVYLLCRLADLSCHLVYLFCLLVYLFCRLVSLWLCLVYFGGTLKSRLDHGLDFGFWKKIIPESPSSATF